MIRSSHGRKRFGEKLWTILVIGLGLLTSSLIASNMTVDEEECTEAESRIWALQSMLP